MANNVSILFWLKASRTNKKGLAPLMLRISFNQQRKEFSTGFSIEPSKWDKSRYRVKNKTHEANQINLYIDETKGKIMSIFKEMVLNEDISLDRLVDRFLGKDEQTITLLQLVKYHNENFKSRIGVDFAFSTYEKYDITARRLESFLLEHYKKPDFRLKDLSNRFISDFDYYLKSVHKNDHNTTTKYCKNLKKILNVAVANNWIESNPFQGYKASYKEGVNNHAHIIRANKNVLLEEYIELVFCRLDFDHLKTRPNGGKLQKGELEKIKFPLPNYKEQKNIVDKVKLLNGEAKWKKFDELLA